MANEIPANAANLTTGATDTGFSLPTSAQSDPGIPFIPNSGPSFDDWVKNIPGAGGYNEWNKKDWWKAVLDPFDLGGWRSDARENEKLYKERMWEAYKLTNEREWERNKINAQMAYDTYMSNTAIQRRMADLAAAGVNPLLALGSIGDASSPTISGSSSSPASASGAASSPGAKSTNPGPTIAMLLMAVAKLMA